MSRGKGYYLRPDELELLIDDEVLTFDHRDIGNPRGWCEYVLLG